MDDRRRVEPDPQTSAALLPLPVVLTLEAAAPAPSASPLSFTIPAQAPPHAPSWLDLLGQR